MGNIEAVKRVLLLLLLAGSAAAQEGLRITDFLYLRDGWAMVQVRNEGTSATNFDYHLLRGLEYDTGKISSGSDVRFNLREIASYWVKPGEVRRFQVYFSGGRLLAAVAWAGSEDWHRGSKTLTREEAIADTREMLIERRKGKRAFALRPVPGSK